MQVTTPDSIKIQRRRAAHRKTGGARSVSAQARAQRARRMRRRTEPPPMGQGDRKWASVSSLGGMRHPMTSLVAIVRLG